MQQSVIFGKIEIVPGRNRILIKWDGVNNSEHSLQYVLPGDRILNVGHCTSGSESIEGLAEGSVTVGSWLA